MLHDGMDAMDVIGPLEVFSHAQHDKKDPGKYEHPSSTQQWAD